MSKNKFSWIIAMVLTAAFMIPIANAQVLSALAGVNWYYLLVNAAVIFLVLFLLQAVLVPNKDGKEKTSMWLIMLVTALLISWIYGGGGYIWKTGFIGQFFATYVWYVVLVNAAVIGVLLYFIFGLLKVNEKLGGNKEGQTGYVILILIISLALAIKLGGNNWIWSQPIVLRFYDYAFGAQGILNPSWGLWTFLGAGFLLSFFFNNYLLKDAAAGNKFVNYGLALLMAANMASAGVSGRAVVRLGEVIFVLFLAKQLETSVPYAKEYGLNWVVAIILVGWASAAATYGTSYQGTLAGIVGGPLTSMGLIEAGPNAPPQSGAGWWGTAGIGALIIGGIVLVVLMMSGKGEGKNKGAIAAVVIILLALAFYFGKYSLLLLLPIIFLFFVIFRGETRRRALTLAWGEIKKRLNAISGSAKYKRETPFGREPQFFRENRLLFHAIANWTTRSEITYRYWAVVKDAGKMWLKVKDDISEFTDMEKLRKELITFRSGGKYQDQQIEGWNKLNLQVADLLNRYYKLLARIQLSAAYKLKDAKDKPDPALWGIETDEMTSLQTEAVNLTNKIKSDYERYNDRVKAYGAHYVLKAYKDIILHMSNVVGDVLEHPQKFARPGAEYNVGDQNPLVKSNRAGKNAEGLPTDEVNQFGEVMADIVEQKDSFGSLSPDPRVYKKPRKLVNASDIIDYPKFVEFIDNIEKDWKGLAEDIRYGLHHPKSRTVKSYLDALREGKYYEWADLDIKQINSPSLSDWSLDMRALADPGKNYYWGRKHFFSETVPINNENIPPDNPLPILSSLGLKQFLIEASIKDGMDRAKITEFLNKYHADSATPEKELPHYPIGVMLGEEAAKAEHGS